MDSRSEGVVRIEGLGVRLAKFWKVPETKTVWFKVQGSRFKVQGSGFRVQGLGFWGLTLRLEGSG